MTAYRLASGGRIDRQTRLQFTFDGKPFTGFAGDTVASALMGGGQTLMGRSFKYHRPRGVVTANSAEPNALLTIGTGGRREPNTRATVQELYQGLVAESQNRWPSLALDIGAINGLFSSFLSAGFYYKTFMWPAGFWEKVYEPLIRKAAGLGRAGFEADPDVYEKAWAHCDLLVVGAGPAGLAAALTAARTGAVVILADEGQEPGGTLLHEIATIGGQSAHTFLRGMLGELQSMPNVRILSRTTVFGWYDDMVFGAVERVQKHVAGPDRAMPVERLWRIAARRALLATGGEERPIAFANNDLPGIMTADAATAYAHRFGVAVGRSVAVFANSDAGARTVRALQAAGVTIAGLIDPRDIAPVKASSVPCFGRGTVVAASGRKTLSGIEIEIDGRRSRLDADALAISGGHNPRIHLALQRGAKAVWHADLGQFLAPETVGSLPCAGAVAGAATLSACLAEGSRKAAGLIADLGRAAQEIAFGPIDDDWTAAPVAPLWRVAGGKGKAFVDFQNDVKVEDLGLAIREGYDHVELAKRYTTNGMATDQGKLSNVTAIGLIAEARGLSVAEVGTTTFRPFYTPVSFGALAGPARGMAFQPVRRSPLSGWAKNHGAVVIEAGLWMRSSHFPIDGEAHWRETVDREVRAVRAGVGLCDVSTLGKIEISGGDAAVFLDRIYANGFAKLPVGRARYGLMLREDGFVYDDGTTSRLDETLYVMTTTTAQAAGVLSHLEFHAQAVWPDLDVRLASVTDQWAQMAIAGPNARAVLESLVDADLSNEAFPFMAARVVTLGNGAIEARLFRISFSGELAYELAVPAGYGDAVAEALMIAGRPFGIVPYGIEALGVLRIEKGHVTHNEINGTVTAADLGLGRLISATKTDFIGRAMLDRDGLRDVARPQLVGLQPLDPAKSFKAGAHLLDKGATATLENDQGYITSAAYSPHVGSMIGLALVSRGSERLGAEMLAWNALDGEFTPVRLVSPVFVDPENRRLHG